MSDSPAPAPSRAPPPAPNPNTKSRGLILVLGLLAPGLGHAFIGHAKRGAVYVAIPIVVLVLATFLPANVSVGLAIGIVGAVFTLTYVASMFDAAFIIPVT